MTSAKGFNGSVDFDGRTVTIKRKGAGVVSLPVSSISSVEFKTGGLTVGYVRFHSGAASDGRVSRNKTEALLKDPHTVTLQWTSNKAFEALVAEVQAAIGGGGAGVQGGGASELVQLAALHSSGVLSDDEFAAAKAKLLS